MVQFVSHDWMWWLSFVRKAAQIFFKGDETHIKSLAIACHEISVISLHKYLTFFGRKTFMNWSYSAIVVPVKLQ